MRVFLLGIMVAATSLTAQTGARYLIITHDNFYNAIQPLAQWKQKKGMASRVVRTSETGTASLQIQSYIRNAYNTWNPRPEFVLLVGGGAYLQAFQMGMGHERIATDNPYGNMAGDYRAELPYGRFPCNSVRQCSVMVAKTLAYERTPDLADTLWYRRGTTIVNDSADDDGYTYWQDARSTAQLAAAAGYSAIDSLASLRHHNAWNVTQSVNSGTSFVLYRGVGVDYWRTPFDVRPYFSQMINGDRLPIICSFTCQTISLDQYNDSMTGNTWVKLGTPQALNGAVACIGNVHSASNVAGKRSAMTRGYFSGVFSESLQYLGAAMLRGKLQIYNEYHDSLEYHGFNLLGDPELNIWTTTPRPMVATYAAEIPFGPQNFPVTVTRQGNPLPNALVCISSGSGIYQYGYTDAGGQKSFSINPGVEEMMDVTVTARNCVPHEGQVWIYNPSAVAEPRPLGEQAHRLLSISPNPGSGVFTISCRRAALIDIRDVTGRTVARFRIPGPESPDRGHDPDPKRIRSCPLLVWDARNVPAGVYLVRAESAHGETEVRTLGVLK
jgi:hypothetical protein